jgi:hypothetical protein
LNELERIAAKLKKLIAENQDLILGKAIASVMPGQTGGFQTNAGTINAIATSFCNGDCLLAKVDGAWYAINPNDNREVVRSNVDRMVWRRPRLSTQNPTVAVIKSFIIFGINPWIGQIRFASNQKITQADPQTLIQLNIDVESIQVGINPIVNTAGYTRNGTRSFLQCVLIQFDLDALKAQIGNEYKYIYYGNARGLIDVDVSNDLFPIDFNPRSGDGYLNPTALISSLALEEESTTIMPTDARDFNGQSLGSYWTGADFDRSYQRSPSVKLGIRNSAYNNRFSYELTGYLGFQAALGLYRNTNAYGFEMFGHLVVRLDLENPADSAFVANSAASAPLFRLPYTGAPNNIGTTEIFASSFTSDLENIDENQDPYSILYA